VFPGKIARPKRFAVIFVNICVIITTTTTKKTFFCVELCCGNHGVN